MLSSFCLYRSRSRTEPTAGFELLCATIQTYVHGSFEAGTWVSNGQHRYCASVKMHQASNPGDFGGLLDTAENASKRKWHSLARLLFSHACRIATQQLEGESIDLVRDLIYSMWLDGYDVPSTAQEQLQLSLKLVVQYLSHMLVLIHGPVHPSTHILKTLPQVIWHNYDEERVEICLQGVRDCTEETLGPYHKESIRNAFDPRWRVSQSNVQNVLDQCDGLYGQTSMQSLQCLQLRVFHARAAGCHDDTQRFSSELNARLGDVEAGGTFHANTVREAYLVCRDLYNKAD